jgi:hypothetical protein
MLILLALRKIQTVEVLMMEDARPGLDIRLPNGLVE